MKHNFEDGPVASEEHTPSEPSSEKEFLALMHYCAVHDPSLGSVLKEMERRKQSGIKAILESALASAGHDWRDLQNLRENPEAAAAFNHLVTFWDHPVDGEPRDPEQRWQEALKFAKLLSLNNPRYQ